MNITLFIGNEVLNVFSCNNFFENSNLFGENREKHFWRTLATGHNCRIASVAALEGDAQYLFYYMEYR